ncbi:MAG: ATP-dependent sacrificial sulfur transferase LarE, partial [Candidatus Thermoplasmatota archaeon]|nr:ATP-dependent sacrificial sulfur transferase LarE [Candidatus Thermoplasmatota archaeon]
RCYYCKKIIFNQLQQLAKQHTTMIIIEGSTTDDTKEYRPGRKALKELNIHSPLLDVGLTKQEIRTLSKRMGLPTWNKPASPCLATRFPYNTTITIKKLRQVEQAEQYLKSLGFTIVRVRHHHTLARIEVPKNDMPTLIQNNDNIYKNLKKIGYHYITIDLGGYHSGCYDGEKNL